MNILENRFDSAVDVVTCEAINHSERSREGAASESARIF